MIIVIISEVTLILQRERIFLLASHCLNIHVMSMSDFLLRESLHTSGWHKNQKLCFNLGRFCRRRLGALLVLGLRGECSSRNNYFREIKAHVTELLSKCLLPASSCVNL